MGAPCRPLVLASGSRFRAEVLAGAGLEVRIESPEVDERALDELLESTGVEEYALVLAEAKARSVAQRLALGDEGRPPGTSHPSNPSSAMVADLSSSPLIIGADQLGVLGQLTPPLILHKQSTAADAVEQLMAMSGTTHRLVNGIVVLDISSGVLHRGVDVMTVSMREFTRAEAADYVDRFEPFDSAGSYRIEDQDLMGPQERFIVGIDGEDPSGVLGMPLPLLRRMLVAAGAWMGPR